MNVNKFLKIKLRNKKGFTLVELLIVVAIISVLATLLMANFIGVRQRARDAQRKADIRQIQSALELYRSDQGNYPAAVNNAVGACNSALTGGSSTYMQKIPCDPNSTYNSGDYYYTSSGTAYQICSCLENTGDNQGVADRTDGNTCGTASNCTTNWYFVVNNP